MERCSVTLLKCVYVCVSVKPCLKSYCVRHQFPKQKQYSKSIKPCLSWCCLITCRTIKTMKHSKAVVDLNINKQLFAKSKFQDIFYSYHATCAATVFLQLLLNNIIFSYV